MLVVLPASMSSRQASETKNVCMNFFAMLTLKKYRFCFCPPSSMSRLRSLNFTFASERMGISTKGFFPPLVARSTDSASFSIFWMVCLSTFSSLGIGYSCSSSDRRGRRVDFSAASSRAESCAASSCSVTLSASRRNSRLMGSGLLFTIFPMLIATSAM